MCSFFVAFDLDWLVLTYPLETLYGQVLGSPVGMSLLREYGRGFSTSDIVVERGVLDDLFSLGDVAEVLVDTLVNDRIGAHSGEMVQAVEAFLSNATSTFTNVSC